MLCNKCGFEGYPNLEESGPHTKAICRKCGSYIKMLNKKEWEEQINPENNIKHKKTGTYILTSSKTPDNLGKEIETFFKQGYTLYGNPFFGDNCYYQAMIKN